MLITTRLTTDYPARAKKRFKKEYEKVSPNFVQILKQSQTNLYKKEVILKKHLVIQFLKKAI
jgi:hypothetical protein